MVTLTQSEIRANVSSNIITYKKRREQLRITGTLTQEHRKQLQQKINNWNRKIKRMDERKNKIIALGNAVAYFTGINVKGIGVESQRNYRIYNATALFAKYGLEHDIGGLYLSQYMGKHEDAAGRTRLAFTRDFEKYPERKELYHRFCQYMERLEQESIENNDVNKYL